MEYTKEKAALTGCFLRCPKKDKGDKGDLGKTLFRKLGIIVIWIVIAVGFYQCSNHNPVEYDSVQESEETAYEEEQAEKNIEVETDEEISKEKVQKGYIRVLLKTDFFSGIYHDELIFSSEKGLYIEQNKKVTNAAPNEEYKITSKDMEEGRISIHACKDGRIRLHNVIRTEEVLYRGCMECIGTKDGLVLINELPVEEYLYGVVPSEMPSSYPIEAIKAQAICARTYTYFHMASLAYPEWNAHVDDSTTFQVYQNISENEKANQAVDATKNQVMLYQDELIESFYYSTSSGRSSGYEVWNPREEKQWLQGKALMLEQNYTMAADFSYHKQDASDIIQQKENAYRTYITLGNVNDVECQEAWYRWKYTRSFDDTQEFLERIAALAAKYPDKVSIRTKYRKKEKLTQESEILSCRITQRSSSGMVQQLCIQTKNYEIVVNMQQCIRETLAKRGDMVRKNDGIDFTLGELLPSAYFYFDALYENNGLKSMTIYGGGFGHGAGMSQNGAKCQANLGMSAEDILKYYYNDIVIETWE